MEHYDAIQQLIDRVRRRWRTLQACRAVVRVALAAAVVAIVALSSIFWAAGAPKALAAIAIGSLVAIAAISIRGLLPLARRPPDRQVARFIEERAPSLEDRLVSAVEVARDERTASAALARPLMADAVLRASAVDVDAVIARESVRRAIVQAAAAALALAAVLVIGRGPARQVADATSLTLFPGRVTLAVTPGNARIKAGTPVTIEARLVGNRAPVMAQLQVADGDRWRATDMAAADPGAFRLTTEPAAASFKYRVVAGTIVSPSYDVVVARPPRVTRIDVDYTYPAGLNLKPRTERDGGDIYAPAGTDVRVRVFTDAPAAHGEMALSNGNTLALAADKPNELSASLKVVEDASYRVALADREGLSNPGDTEYFIRTLEDRPPEVRILKPAADRSVTRLEEVDVQAEAEDDYGVARLDLVYAVHGGNEKVVPLRIAPNSTTVTGQHTLYLEDLDVKPGDFVSYYVRARDLTRGTRPNEARSDMFFLEVKPYEQEFQLAQSSSMAGGGANSNIDDLVTAQKDIVVATWKLDRRAQSAKGAKSEQDIRSVGRAETELKTRVEQTSSSFRESTMRDPRRRPGQAGRGGQPESPRAGQTLAEEDEMTAAAGAMGRAAESLEALKTAPAIGPELEALNHLLKAQADVKKREVTRQASGNGGGNNRSNYDMSALFDKELQKQQQTNYETKSTAEQRQDASQSALDKIRELARRQDELLKKQAELSKNRESLTPEELKRELEKLTREQSELRQRAEEMARQMASSQQSPSQSPSKGQQSQSQSQSGGQQSQSGQSGQQSQSGQSGSSGEDGKRMRDVSEEMRNAASDLRRENPSQASASGARALQKLREMERQLQHAQPDEQRRALGEMQLEARQLADAQRQVANELTRTGSQKEAGKDPMRRMAGEQERLAERARKLQDGLKRQGSQPGAGEAAKDLERQHLADRMQQAAEALRAASERGPTAQRGNTADGPQPGDAKAQAAAQDAMARELDKVADKLSSAAGTKDVESRKLSEQLARVQEQREKLNRLSRQIDEAGGRQNGSPSAQSGSSGRQNGGGGQQGSSPQKSPGQSGRVGEGQQGGGAGPGTEVERLREQYARQLQETRDMLNQLAREDQTFARGGAGLTFEGRGMVMSAPGTEAFKQDFAKWDDLKRQATQALDNAESAISKKLQAKQAKDRLAAGSDDKAPPEYKKQVDSYFKAIAGKKKP